MSNDLAWTSPDSLDHYAIIKHKYPIGATFLPRITRPHQTVTISLAYNTNPCDTLNQYIIHKRIQTTQNRQIPSPWHCF